MAVDTSNVVVRAGLWEVGAEHYLPNKLQNPASWTIKLADHWGNEPESVQHEVVRCLRVFPRDIGNHATKYMPGC